MRSFRESESGHVRPVGSIVERLVTPDLQALCTPELVAKEVHGVTPGWTCPSCRAMVTEITGYQSSCDACGRPWPRKCEGAFPAEGGGTECPGNNFVHPVYDCGQWYGSSGMCEFCGREIRHRTRHHRLVRALERYLNKRAPGLRKNGRCQEMAAKLCRMATPVRPEQVDDAKSAGTYHWWRSRQHLEQAVATWLANLHKREGYTSIYAQGSPGIGKTITLLYASRQALMEDLSEDVLWTDERELLKACRSMYSDDLWGLEFLATAETVDLLVVDDVFNSGMAPYNSRTGIVAQTMGGIFADRFYAGMPTLFGSNERPCFASFGAYLHDRWKGAGKHVVDQGLSQRGQKGE